MQTPATMLSKPEKSELICRNAFMLDLSLSIVTLLALLLQERRIFATAHF